MTDARFPERWLNDRRIVRLSDRAFRLFVTSLAWSVSNRTDGLLDPDDLRLLHSADEGAAEELVKAGLWGHYQAGWRIHGFGRTQTTSAQLEGVEHKRAMDRERQARHRMRQRAQANGVTRDVTRDGTRDTKDRPGQAGQAPTGADSQPGCSWCNGAGCPNCSEVVDA